MMRHASPSDRIRIAAACSAMSVVILAWTIVGGSRASDSQSDMTSVLPAPASTGLERAEPTSNELIDSALDRDPFSSTRQRPTLRYGATAATVVARTAPAPEVLRLVGTVLDSMGTSFVLCQLGSSTAHVIRVGQTLGTYQLRSISQGSAIFVTGDGQRLELHVPKAGS